MDSADGMLPSSIDHYHCRTVCEFPDSAETFEVLLKASIGVWIDQGVRGLWLLIPIQKSFLINVAVRYEFKFHHCQSRDRLYMNRWLLDTESEFPQPPHTFLGVGGIVINDKNELLVIQEKYVPLDQKRRWKIPGGMVDPGEDIEDAARREVFEETGIETKFRGFVGFRHLRKMSQFGMSDLYFVVRLEPMTNEIKISLSELHDAKWISVDEFLVDADANEYTKSLVRSMGSSLDSLFECIQYTPNSSVYGPHGQIVG